ncbi:MAG: 50S ribosomal protein L21 [Christensenellales bacterium]
MYAIVMTGGKQYKVAEGDVIKVEKLDAEVGASVDLEAVMVNKDGELVYGGSAKAEVLAQDKAKKIVIFRYKAKKNVRKRQGHRQPFTALKITSIQA